MKKVKKHLLGVNQEGLGGWPDLGTIFAGILNLELRILSNDGIGWMK